MANNWTYATTDESAANTAKTVTITKPTGKEIHIHSLAIGSRGADISSDVTVTINDNAIAIWAMEFRAGQVFGGFFDFSSCPIPIRAGDATIVADAGGAGVIMRIAATYEIR